MAADGIEIFLDRVQRTLADAAANHIDAAHAGLRCERHELRGSRLQFTLTQPEFLLRQHHDAAAFRRFIGQRSQLRSVGENALFHARRRQECHRLTIAQGDRASLVQQQYVDIASCLNRTARSGDHIGADHPIHAGNADRRKQCSDRGWNQAYQQCDQHGQCDRVPNASRLHAVDRIRQQGSAGQQEDQSELGQQDGQRDLVRRLAP